MPDDKPPIPPGSGDEPRRPAVSSDKVTAEPMNVPPIPLDPAKAPAPLSLPAVPGKKEPEVKDSFRELIETVVFVVVLVLMLKTNLAEAFVIPTGSMADTLYGYHIKVTCTKCGYTSAFNAKDEADPEDGIKKEVAECRCENCGWWNKLR